MFITPGGNNPRGPYTVLHNQSMHYSVLRMQNSYSSVSTQRGPFPIVGESKVIQESKVIRDKIKKSI